MSATTRVANKLNSYISYPNIRITILFSPHTEGCNVQQGSTKLNSKDLSPI